MDGVYIFFYHKKHIITSGFCEFDGRGVLGCASLSNVVAIVFPTIKRRETK